MYFACLAISNTLYRQRTEMSFCDLWTSLTGKNILIISNSEHGGTIMADEKTSTKASAAGQPSTTASIIANMDETDWKTMLMEMRVLSA